ncbi:MAG: hypothetical protein KKE73_13695 [Proteobacteria bacterium]|nr:hypothetical protein [Pseudomonadota bacterium]
MKFTPVSNYRKESGGTRFLRSMLLICVFIGVAWLYTKHFDHAIEDIQTRSSVLDKSGSLSSKQKSQFRDFAKLFRDELGIDLVLRVASGTPEPPQLKSKSLYIGIDSTGGKIIVVFPPWIEKSLGPGFNDELQEHMRPYFESNSWPTGLMKALQLIWERVTGLATGGQG